MLGRNPFSPSAGSWAPLPAGERDPGSRRSPTRISTEQPDHVPEPRCPMPTWTVAGVQMDCRLADKPANLRAMTDRLAAAADRGARLVVFPECALTGYGFESRGQAGAAAEPLPGPAADAIAAACARRNVWAVFGLL